MSTNQFSDTLGGYALFFLKEWSRHIKKEQILPDLTLRLFALIPVATPQDPTGLTCYWV